VSPAAPDHTPRPTRKDAHERVWVAGEEENAESSKGAPDWAGLARVSRRQEAVFRRAQLLALRFSDEQIKLLIAGERFTRRFRGVYSDALARETARSHLWAAQLALGQRAFFSHRTAAALLGLRQIDTRQIELTVISGHTPRRNGLIVRRCSFEPMRAELRTSDGLRHSSATRMLFEEADREDRQELDRLLQECARREMLHLDQINGLIERHGHLPGAVQLRDALTRYQPMSAEDKSRFERDFAAWLATLLDIPQPLRNQEVAGWEFDYYWPEHRLVVETDGDPYHRTPQERERDNRKLAWCQTHDHRILRISGFTFAHDRAAIYADLSAILHRR
jgi:very-short-patch-repair endonuclease